jgi:Uma2 family endonuclease
MASAAVKLMTADQFLLWSQDQEVRCELIDGILIEMMTGASDVHDLIVTAVIALLRQQRRGTPC